MRHTDSVAEIQNTLRQSSDVVLTECKVQDRELNEIRRAAPQAKVNPRESSDLALAWPRIQFVKAFLLVS